MLDKDLAELYDVPTKVLNQAVSRNRDRFPEDFMFQLTAKEYPEASRSQIVTLKRGQNMKYLPYAFTEQGVAMLSSVLRSPRAVAVNIEIMRAFVRMRALIESNKVLAKKIAALESKYDKQFATVFQAIYDLMDDGEKKPKRKIGFV